MATTFFVRTKRKSGYANLCVRVQSSSLHVNIRQSTHLKVPVQKWNLSRSSLAFREFVASAHGRILFRKIEEIRLSIDQRLISGQAVTSGQVKQIVYEIVFREYIQNKNHSMSLNGYIAMYLAQAENGSRKTHKGLSFSKGTVKTIRSLLNLMKAFQDSCGLSYDFNDIDYEFRNRFMDYLYEQRGYNVNTAAKYMNTLITILSASESEGYHSNHKYMDRQFRAKRKEVDNVYLTKEELRAMMDADLSGLSKIYETARDIFMVGVYTAQRVSDYNNIGPENIIRNADGKLIVSLRQKKTSVCVSIPVKAELALILEKYNYCLPRIADKSLNTCIKEVARLAGIDTPVTIELTTGGGIKFDTRPKYALIHSHTARRTGATLMYLAGMDVFNICSVTGHSSIAMLKKYIKADEIERARTISSDAAFMKW